MSNKNLQQKQFDDFFFNEVNNVIPQMIKEYSEETGLTQEEENNLLKDSMVHERHDDNILHYIFMNEPYVEVIIYLDPWCENYIINIKDQLSERVMFQTREYNAFINFWNNEIVPYFNYSSHLPEMQF